MWEYLINFSKNQTLFSQILKLVHIARGVIWGGGGGGGRRPQGKKRKKRKRERKKRKKIEKIEKRKKGTMLGDLKKFPQISFVRWWHPAVHLFHSYNFCSISWNTYHHFQWHSLLDELEQTASQSIKNWISSHWHKTTASQIFWSNKLISQQWNHPSQFLCSQSWLHLWLWHVFLWSNQLCIQI